MECETDRSLATTARTVDLAFAADPLIRWLRPYAAASSQPDSTALKWQYRRVQSIMAHGTVLISAHVGQMMHEFPITKKEAVASQDSDTTPGKTAQLVCSEQVKSAEGQDAGAVVFLFPPKKQLDWSFSRLLMKCKVWALDLLDPVCDEGSKMKRIDKLMAAHSKSMQFLQREYSGNLWYLEVVAVHPSLQSRGIGRGVMEEILEHIHRQPIYLECTREENLGFYQSLGFRLIEEVELTDDEVHDETGRVKYWAMMRADESTS
ncbi:hypothetical protein N7532_009300 [Penicillium argentinense]|uniref:N-acetyltransferase domain-containing protein n=1 Tax=Penicillium argentinense TaxID=1131581 RepID=A0A9W9K2U8_9EURO|nr:uncharacterized protein N7532_009300 [Penicillium argentinense]KAJ5090616.1 hypothetical protein N7532_009300 [Penicillium argentinense]